MPRCRVRRVSGSRDSECPECHPISRVSGLQESRNVFSSGAGSMLSAHDIHLHPGAEGFVASRVHFTLEAPDLLSEQRF